MGKIISIVERQVKARGLHKGQQIDEQKLQEFFFDDDYERLQLLPRFNPLQKEVPVLFYPGCGSDIFTPLLYLERLFPTLKEIEFLFVDKDDYLGLIKTTLDDTNVAFEQYVNRIQFYWRGMLVMLWFYTDNVFSSSMPEFDIYFEKAFRIMKEQFQGYEDKVFAKLKRGGLLISDSGFKNIALQRIEVDTQLSSYREMIMGWKI